jgi:nitrous oxidase accessory protein
VKSVKNSSSRRVFAVVLALIVVQVVGALSLRIQPVKAAPQTIVVPGNCPTIGDAIGNATQGDTILVKKGVYYENLVVDKSLTLKSEYEGAAVVVGAGGVERGAKAVFTITADNVFLSGFTIRSENYSSTSVFATGIQVSANNCSIDGNDISGGYFGIFSSFTSSSSIIGNNVTAAIKDGVRICGGSQNTISNNEINGNAASGIALEGYSDMIADNSLCRDGRGIGLGASYSTFFGNNVTGTIGVGLYLGGSNNIIDSNYIAQNVVGVFLTSSFAAPNNNTIYRNSFVNNNQSASTASVYNNESWDSGSQGNYWSDYNGTDANGDGIGDTPYKVFTGNIDRYPLMNPVVLTPSAPPSLPNAPAAFNGTVSCWNFDNVEPNGVTPDALGNNPMIVETTHGALVSPSLVNGESGNALRFNGSDYAYVAASPTLNILGEFTVDAWVNPQNFKNVSYNAIIEECLRTQAKYPTRIFGFAINGVAPQNSSQPVLGALRGFFLDNEGVFNEIVTTQALPSNQWSHVAFVRSFSSGMHIYVNDEEQNVTVTSGVQNPTGSVAYGSEFYIGHDSFDTLDNLSISTAAVEQETQPSHLWAEWWFWTATLAAITILLATAVFFIRRRSKRT